MIIKSDKTTTKKNRDDKIYIFQKSTTKIPADKKLHD